MALFAFLAAACFAQDFRAKVQGRVTDTSDAVIPGANVTLLNVKTGVRLTREANNVGLYRIDNVDSGTYTISIEAGGFGKFQQENFEIQAQADLTINAALKPGGVQETITVSESPVAVDFNSAGVRTTVDSKLANDVPRLDRNPFKLSLLNPAVLETRRQEMNPFQSLSPNSLDLGGGTSQRNDLLVDGSPITIGVKASYTPNPDAIQEVNIQQNSVDAESGHSAGGVISMTLKSGTNDVHGNVFYVGRNPALNAVTDRTTGNKIAARYNVFGGVIGHPIIKNKLFNFGSYEQWKQLIPQSVLKTVPTAAERAGDYSQSLNINGGVRTIYDPYSTILDPATGRVTRTAFPGNKLPASRFDPLAAKFIQGIYQPNASPDNITGLNNFKYTPIQNWNYYNMSDRADWFVNDKWRVYGRFSKYLTYQDQSAPLMQASPSYGPQGTARHAWTATGNAIYTMNARTVLDFRTDYHTMIDDNDYPKYFLPDNAWESYWPNNPWYKPYKTPGWPTFNPYIGIGGSNFYGLQGTLWWHTHINGSSFAGKMSHQMGSHFIKVGFDNRRTGGVSTTNAYPAFNFGAAMTADTFNNPNTKVVGNEFASFLLGAIGPDSVMATAPIGEVNTELYSVFVQDDYKLSRRISLNLGLRYELEVPFHDGAYAESRGLDLSVANPEMQKTPPVMPASVLALRNTPLKYNGAWVFTSSENPNVWNTQKNVFLPRIGLAFKVDDRTAIRVGYARYSTPSDLLNYPTTPPGSAAPTLLAPPYGAFSATQSAPALLQGVPQATFSNPFPANNPLIPPLGKTVGGYYGLGNNNLTYYDPEFKRTVNERLNVTFSRQLPNQILGEVTYFANWGRNLPFIYNANAMDPQIGYTNKTAIDANVSNPFFNYLTPSVFPGTLRNQATVAVKTLLVPYPQYGNLFVIQSGRHERYDSLSVKIQRPFQHGYNFLMGYSYSNERDEQFFDEVAAYKKVFDWFPSANGRHRLSFASTYQIPFGKGRPFLSQANRLVDAAVGGWQIVGTAYYKSGDYLRFGKNSNNLTIADMVASGDPTVSSPTPQKWFDTSVFRVLPVYTPRANPWQYDGLKGPRYFEVQGTLSKTFTITERFKAELKISAFNLTNRLNRDLPDMNVLSSTFGQALRQSNFTTGRQMEYGLKIVF